ncbi:MAG TPA: heme biosynthesis HemY N-terminal domain-containing protein [Thiobacillaceae bacterium]|nr:heme biosynthesis HemY N-terminal domain-containing protein [Thiobacillaceae bacterium]HNU64871.1 heme biosynthesis HemY N-terminal domain-containing protein [Thiobacillaceae bacterium]
MRLILWVLALFALAVAFTLLARLDQGYVIVVFPPWRLEMSFMLTLVLLVGGFVLAGFVLRLARTALRLPDDLRAWRQRRQRERADLALLDALRAHLDGNVPLLRKQLDKAGDCTAQDLLERLRASLGKPVPDAPPDAAPQGVD